MYQIDPKTGEMVIMGVDAKKPYYVIGIVSGRLPKLATIPAVIFFTSCIREKLAGKFIIQSID